MAENQGNTAVPSHGDRDRVAMLSLNADGTPDQHNPEIIGEKEFALEATREQFKQQAVSAVDQAKRPELFPNSELGEQLEQDPAIAELKDAHDSAAKDAEKAADATVGALFTEDAQAPATDAKNAQTDAKPSAGKASATK